MKLSRITQAVTIETTSDTGSVALTIEPDEATGFEFDAIDGQTAGIVFPITITAYDSFGLLSRLSPRPG